jgi:SAM-dependent methyltransferase
VVTEKGEGTGAPRGDARDFWIGRGEMTTVNAVAPGCRNARYESWTRACLQDWTMRRARRLLGRRCGRAVDLGCGFGDWTVQLAAMADDVVACDIAPGFVEETRRRLREAGCPSATVACDDVRSFAAYSDADLVHVGAVLMYLDDDGCQEVLRTVRERIASDGLLIGREWCAIRFGRAVVNRSPWFSVHRRARRYIEMAEAAGFRAVESVASPSIYGDVLAWRWLARRHDAAPAWARSLFGAPWYAASLFWTRGSVTFVLRPV